MSLEKVSRGGIAGSAAALAVSLLVFATFGYGHSGAELAAYIVEKGQATPHAGQMKQSGRDLWAR